MFKKWQPFYLGLNVLNHLWHCQYWSCTGRYYPIDPDNLLQPSNPDLISDITQDDNHQDASIKDDTSASYIQAWRKWPTYWRGYFLSHFLEWKPLYSLQWHHNGHDGISNHQPYDRLLNCSFRRRSKKISKLRVTGLCVGNSTGTGEFHAQRASNAENVSIWWCHHVF